MCLSHDYDGSNSFYCEKLRLARKPYVCCECQKPIATGELYQYATGKNDDQIFSARTCAPCAEIRTAFVCGSWVFGELWESVRSEMFPVWRAKGSWDCLAKLTTPEAVELCNAEYREWLGDDAEPLTPTTEPRQ